MVELEGENFVRVTIALLLKEFNLILIIVMKGILEDEKLKMENFSDIKFSF